MAAPRRLPTCSCCCGTRRPNGTHASSQWRPRLVLMAPTLDAHACDDTVDTVVEQLQAHSLRCARLAPCSPRSVALACRARISARRCASTPYGPGGASSGMPIARAGHAPRWAECSLPRCSPTARKSGRKRATLLVQYSASGSLRRTSRHRPCVLPRQCVLLHEKTLSAHSWKEPGGARRFFFARERAGGHPKDFSFSLSAARGDKENWR